MLMPVRFSSFCVAGTGPMPMIVGSTPTVAACRNVASGLRPFCFAISFSMIRQIVAPSVRGLALPAVTWPSAVYAGFSVASFSSVVSSRGFWSLSTVTLDPSEYSIVIGLISSERRPSFCARTAFLWLSNEKRVGVLPR